MRVHEILMSKGKLVHQILPCASLADAVNRLVEFNCGSLVVSEEEQVLGIITERDILRAIKREKLSLSELVVRDLMTRNLITSPPDAEVSSLMGLMTLNRIRHVPIIEDGKLSGIISIGDLVKAQFELLAVENHQLMSYIQGNVR